MIDQAHEWTDSELEALEKKYSKVYKRAAREMREKARKHLSDYEEANAEWRARVGSGEATADQYDKWRRAQAARSEYLKNLSDTLATDAARTNRMAADLANDTIPKVYAENANYAEYDLEKKYGAGTHMFTLYDENTIRNLMRMERGDQIIKEVISEGIPKPPMQSMRVNPDTAKDVRWNRQKFNAEITQGILQGESIPQISKRLQKVLNMDRNMATRAARTAVTSAENAGRLDSMMRARERGIEVKKQWFATLDERTRFSHRELDKQVQELEDPFVVKSNGHKLMRPADPTAHPSEVWNCRCTLLSYKEGIEDEDPERWSRLPEGMTYEQWKAGKAKEVVAEVVSSVILAGVSQGAPMTFEEANELRGNPNYDMVREAGEEYTAANDAVLEYAREHGYDDSEELARLREARREAHQRYIEASREQVKYRVNCQTCVVANEARRRGYDVEATGNDRSDDSPNRRLSFNTSLAWIDPETGDHPKYVEYDGEGRQDALGKRIPTLRRFTRWLLGGDTLEEGARYTIQFDWRGRSNSGHIVCIERTPEGVRMYDPQCGRKYDEAQIATYFEDVKMEQRYRGNLFSVAPKLLKVSDYEFDTDMCNQILRRAGDGS